MGNETQPSCIFEKKKKLLMGKLQNPLAFENYVELAGEYMTTPLIYSCAITIFLFLSKN
jgi:hypothetical protein